jgi:hypothetical protein
MEIISTGRAWIEYGSKEQATPANRPALICTVDQTSIRPLEKMLAASAPGLLVSKDNGRLKFDFTIGAAGPFALTVRDLKGRMVWTHRGSASRAGLCRVGWSPKAARGIHCVTLDEQGFSRHQKFALME